MLNQNKGGVVMYRSSKSKSKKFKKKRKGVNVKLRAGKVM